MILCRSAAKRCRMKRKQRWQLLSDENRKLKVENVQLRNVLRKLLGEQARWTSQQQQVQLQGDTTQNVCVDGTDDWSNDFSIYLTVIGILYKTLFMYIFNIYYFVNILLLFPPSHQWVVWSHFSNRWNIFCLNFTLNILYKVNNNNNDKGLRFWPCIKIKQLKKEEFVC